MSDRLSDFSPESEFRTLSSLLVGQSGTVAGVRGDSAFELRLMELGFVPGTTVLVRRSSPLADPVEYEVRHNRICLRRIDAAKILIEPDHRPVAPDFR